VCVFAPSYQRCTHTHIPVTSWFSRPTFDNHNILLNKLANNEPSSRSRLVDGRSANSTA
jgi:hypothetical protein